MPKPRPDARPRDPAAPTVRLFGAPAIRFGGAAQALERKAAALLAYLHLEGGATRATVAELLWPGSPPEGARNNLRQLLFKLKRTAGTDAAEGSERLQIAAAVAIEPALADAGELLEGLAYDDCAGFAEWLGRARERVRRDRIATVEKDAAALEAAGELQGAADLAETLIHLDPSRESAHRLAMRLHYVRGDRAAALAAFDRCERVLKEELDAAPSAETRRLAQTIREAQAAPATPAAARPAIPVTVLRPPRLVGRERELAALQQVAGDGGVFFLVGEPGLGKSRLLAELCAAGRGWRVVSARPGDAGIPWATLARLLRELAAGDASLFTGTPAGVLASVLPEIAAPAATVAAGARKLALQDAVADVLERARSSLGLAGIAVDDLHFADAASVEVLHALSAAPGELRWGFAARPAEGGPAAADLATALEEAQRLRTVTLAPLDETQLAALVDSLGVPEFDGKALAPALLRQTGGNPLFALEAIKIAIQSRSLPGAKGVAAPETVTALVGRRLKQLSPMALALARVAAIAGADLTPELAAHVLRTPAIALADAWQELESAQVLRGEAFAHDLIFEATLASVPAAIAESTHRAIAEHLESAGADPARLAGHWLAGGGPERAVPFLVRAAERAEAAARFDTAREWLNRAIAVLEQAGKPAEAFDIQLRLVELLKEVGSLDDALAVTQAMRRNAADPRMVVKWANSRVRALTFRGRFAEAVSTARATLDEISAEDVGGPVGLFELQQALADALSADERFDEVIALLESMQPIGRIHPDIQVRGWFLSDYGGALERVGRLDEAAHWLEAALEAARLKGRNRMIAGVLLRQAQVAGESGRLQEPLDRVHEAKLLMADAPESNLVTFLDMIAGRTLVSHGRYGDAIAAFEASLASPAGRDPAWTGLAHAGLALAFAQLGQAQRCARHLATAEEACKSRTSRAAFTITAGNVAALQGKPVAAPAFDANTRISFRLQAQLLAFRAAPAQADPAAIRDLRTRAAAGGYLGIALAADLCAAESALARGEPSAAAQEAVSALALADRHAAPGWYRAEAWLLCYRVLSADDPELARKVLREGIDWVHTVARYHVPEPFRDSFLSRNRVNRELLRAALPG